MRLEGLGQLKNPMTSSGFEMSYACSVTNGQVRHFVHFPSILSRIRVCVVDFTMLCASEIINPDHISLCFSK
jgi:hypothetical protein